MTTKSDLPEVPAGLLDVALIDAAAAASTGGVSISWWLERVRLGQAPMPKIRRPRHTRWSLASVRAFWAAQADPGAVTTPGGKQVVEVATRASAAAKAAKAAREQPTAALADAAAVRAPRGKPAVAVRTKASAAAKVAKAARQAR